MTRPISPSQIDTWKTCQRKWGIAYLDGVKRPGTASTELGTAVHSHLEAYFRDGVLPTSKDRAGEIALAYLAMETHFDAKSQDIAIEAPWQIDDRWRGVIDLWDRNIVRDHKTTADLKWALSEATLLEDSQGVLYAERVLRSYPSAHLQWHYVTTRPPYKTKHVHLWVVNDAAHRARMDALEDINAEMQALHVEGKAGNDLPPTETSCNKYGGCYYRTSGHCTLSKTSKLDLNKPMEHHPHPAIERASKDGWIVHPQNSMYYYKKDDKSRPPAPRAELITAYEEVLRAELDVPPALPVEDDVPAIPVQAINPPAEDFIPPAPTPVAPAEETPKAKRGRPSKADLEARIAAENARHAAGVETTKATGEHSNGTMTPSFLGPQARAALQREDESISKIFKPASDLTEAAVSDFRVLYVDCLPMSFGRPFDIVRAIVEEVCPAVEKANDVAHWKQIPYGVGTAALAVATRQVLAKSRGDLFLDTRTEEGQAVLSMASAYIVKEGGFVVRGLR